MQHARVSNLISSVSEVAQWYHFLHILECKIAAFTAHFRATIYSSSRDKMAECVAHPRAHPFGVFYNHKMIVVFRVFYSHKWQHSV